MKGHIWKSRTFRFWFISYIMILIVPTLFSVLFYMYTANTLEQRVYDTEQTSIRQVSHSIDERLAQVCSVSDTIYLSSNISRISNLSLPFTPAKYYELHTRGHYLRNFSIQHHLIDYIYVYYSDMDCIVEADHIYTELNQLDKVITQRIGMTRDEFSKAMQKTYLHSFFLQTNTQSILYMRTLYSSNAVTPNITLIIVLNDDSINTLLSTGDSSLGSTYILQPDGSIWGQHSDNDPLIYTEIENFETLSDQQSNSPVVAYSDSKITDFRYVHAVARDALFENLNVMNLTFIISLVAMLILGVLITYVLVRRNYKPLHMLKQKARLTAKDKNDFDALNRKLSDLITSEEKMFDAVEKLNKVANEQLFHSILVNNYENIDISQLEQFGTIFTGNLFIVALIQLDDNVKNKQMLRELKDTNTLSVLLNKLATDLFKGTCEFIIRQEGDSYVAVFCFPDTVNHNEAQVAIRKNMERLLKRLEQHLSITALVSAGDAKLGIGGIHISYTNAIRAQEYAAFIADANNSVVMFDKSMFSANIAWRDYDIVDAERRFISLMLDGNYGRGEQVLNEIFSYYSYRDGISLYVMRCRMFGVMNMMLNVLHEVEPDIDSVFYEESSPAERLFSARTMKELEETVFQIIDHMIGHQECKLTDIRGKILQVEQYVTAHYYDSNLSVQQIASKFGLSLPYLSRMFKKEKGVGLLDYINHHRINKAKEIIAADEAITLSDVAEAVGYNSSQTFIRIFKRYEDVTPGTYRISVEESHSHNADMSHK